MRHTASPTSWTQCPPHSAGIDWNVSSRSIPNGLAGTVELLQHPLHFAMQLAVFAILCKRGSKRDQTCNIRLSSLTYRCLCPKVQSGLTMISVSLTGSWWRHGLLERWSHQSCWHPAWTGPAFGSLPGRDWSEPPRPSRSCAGVRKSIVNTTLMSEFIWWCVQKVQWNLQRPVLPAGRLPLGVVHHHGLLLVGGKHLEVGPVAAQVVHGAEDRGVSYCMSSALLYWELGKVPYSLNSLVDVSPIPPAASGEHLESTWVTFTSPQSQFLLSRSHSHHSDVGVPPVAVISMVNEARRLASQKSQSLLGQQSPGGLHDSAETSESEGVRERVTEKPPAERLKLWRRCAVALCIYTVQRGCMTLPCKLRFLGTGISPLTSMVSSPPNTPAYQHLVYSSN